MAPHALTWPCPVESTDRSDSRSRFLGGPEKGRGWDSVALCGASPEHACAIPGPIQQPLHAGRFSMERKGKRDEREILLLFLPLHVLLFTPAFVKKKKKKCPFVVVF